MKVACLISASDVSIETQRLLAKEWCSGKNDKIVEDVSAADLLRANNSGQVRRGDMLHVYRVVDLARLLNDRGRTLPAHLPGLFAPLFAADVEIVEIETGRSSKDSGAWNDVLADIGRDLSGKPWREGPGRTGRPPRRVWTQAELDIIESGWFDARFDGHENHVRITSIGEKLRSEKIKQAIAAGSDKAQAAKEIPPAIDLFIYMDGWTLHKAPGARKT